MARALSHQEDWSVVVKRIAYAALVIMALLLIGAGLVVGRLIAR